MTGQLGVVPGDPVTAQAWWTVDPTTGATRAVIVPGLGGAINSGSARSQRTPATGISDMFNSGGGSSQLPPSRTKVWDISDKPPKVAEGKCSGNEYAVLTRCVAIPVYWAIVGAFAFIVLVTFMKAIVLALKGIKRLVGSASNPLPRDRLLETKPA